MSKGYVGFPSLEDIHSDYKALFNLAKDVHTIEAARAVQEKITEAVLINGMAIDDYVGQGFTDFDIEWFRYESYGCLDFVCFPGPLWSLDSKEPIFDICSFGNEYPFASDVTFSMLTEEKYDEMVKEYCEDCSFELLPTDGLSADAQEQIKAAREHEYGKNFEPGLSWSFAVGDKHLARVENFGSGSYTWNLWENKNGERGRLCKLGIISYQQSVNSLADAVAWVLVKHEPGKELSERALDSSTHAPEGTNRLTYFENGKWRMDLPNGSQWSGKQVDRIAQLENEAEQRAVGQSSKNGKTMELPCALGDKIYSLERGRINEWTVNGIHLLPGGRSNVNASRCVLGDRYIHTVFDYEYEIGHTLFFSFEAAEKARGSLDAQIQAASAKAGKTSPQPAEKAKEPGLFR